MKRRERSVRPENKVEIEYPAKPLERRRARKAAILMRSHIEAPRVPKDRLSAALQELCSS